MISKNNIDENSLDNISREFAVRSSKIRDRDKYTWGKTCRAGLWNSWEFSFLGVK